MREFVAQVFELNHGLLHTIVDLVQRPGPVIRGIFAGRRRSYTGPVTYAILAAAFSLLRDSALPRFRAAVEALMTARTTARSVYSPRQIEVLHDMQAMMTTNKFVFIAALIVPMALTFGLFFRRRGINFAEAGTFACYGFGTATFIAVPLSLPFAIAANVAGDFAVSYAVTFAYLLYAALGVFGASFSTVWRLVAALVLGGFILGIVPVALAIALAR